MAVLLFFGLAYPHHLHYQEQYQLFLFDSTYVWEIVKQPGGIADLLVYPETIVYTVIIKAINAVFFSSKGDKLLTKRNALMTIPSGLVTVVGYSVSKLIRQLIAGDSFHSALVNGLWKAPENAIQAAASALIFIVIAVALDRADIKKRMLRDL